MDIIRGKKPSTKARYLLQYLNTKVTEMTGMECRVEIKDFEHWADAQILNGVVVFRFSPEVLEQPPQFIQKLAIHELAHILDAWLLSEYKIPNRTDHDKLWRKLCRMLGDTNPGTKM